MHNDAYAPNMPFNFPDALQSSAWRRAACPPTTADRALGQRGPSQARPLPGMRSISARSKFNSTTRVAAVGKDGKRRDDGSTATSSGDLGGRSSGTSFFFGAYQGTRSIRSSLVHILGDDHSHAGWRRYRVCAPECKRQADRARAPSWTTGFDRRCSARRRGNLHRIPEADNPAEKSCSASPRQQRQAAT